jgi:hypothetical protein
MRFHAQNLNDKNGGRQGSMFWYGRWWWHLTEKVEVRCEWHWGLGLRCMVDIGGGDSDAIGMSLGLGFLTVYLTLVYWPWHLWLTDKTKRRDQKYGNGRELGFYFHEWALWVRIWSDPDEWRSADPKWMSFTIHLDDLLLGKVKYSERVIGVDMCEVPMPERVYLAHVKIFESQWKRSRWPWAKRQVRSEITPLMPIPIPGKGSAAYNCGEDATHSMTCAADTPLKAVVALVESTLRHRWQYGGKTWRPGQA